jgi:Glyoxalase/Bleomycin resistance protein/Dioxygenase superfamily
MISLEPIYQMAFVVDDLDRSIADWNAQTGAGPFFVIPHFSFIDARYEGVSSELDISIALGYSGEVMIELIVCHSSFPSPFSHLLDVRKPALHHVARLTRDFEASIAHLVAVGANVDFTASFPPATRMAYVDTRSSMGCFTEIIEETDALLDLRAMMHASAKEWDGKEVIRSLG